MANERIQRRELWKRLNNIKQNEWLKAGKRLDLIASSSSGKGSHGTLRDPKYSPDDIKSLVITIPKNLYKEMNHVIFTQLLDHGFIEDQIWKALKMLK